MQNMSVNKEFRLLTYLCYCLFNSCLGRLIDGVFFVLKVEK